MQCPTCSAELPEPKGRGRPQAYCDKHCRDLAAARVTRLKRRLEANEVRYGDAEARSHSPVAITDEFLRKPLQEMRDLAAEHVAITAELLGLKRSLERCHD